MHTHPLAGRRRAGFLAVPLFVVVLSVAHPGASQVIDVPTFTVGTAPPDWVTALPDAAVALDGTVMFLWNEVETGVPDPLRALVTRRFTAAGVPLAPAIRTEMHGLVLEPAIAAEPAGSYVTTWLAAPKPTSTILFGRRLDVTGAPLGAAFTVDPARNTSSGRGPAVAGLSIGSVFVWWTYSPNSIVARLYDVAGRPRDFAFVVGASGFDPFLDVVAVAGGFVVGWSPRTSGEPSLGRAFAVNGQPLGDAFVLSDDASVRHLAATPDGDLVAAVAVRTTDSGQEIWARRFAPDGTPLAAAFLVYADDTGQNLLPDVELDPNGNLYVAWSQGLQVGRVQAFDGNDDPIAPPFDVAQTIGNGIRVARLEDGRMLNAWTGYFSGEVSANVVSLCVPGSAVCGDAVLDRLCEQCDDGVANSDTAPDACRSNCRPARCGDGVVDAAESCDDGNRQSCDGCSLSCVAEVGLGCGDGVPFPACGELCDDGNAIDGDGCAVGCVLERVPGGGTPATDCYTEWSVDNPANEPFLDKKGGVNAIQRCVDDDPRCDFDAGTPGSCVFHVRVCANNTELPRCEPGSRLAGWELKVPSAGRATHDPVAAAVRAAFLSTIPATIIGPDMRDFCSPTVGVTVPLRASTRPGTVLVKSGAEIYTGARDGDTLRLLCLPAGGP